MSTLGLEYYQFRNEWEAMQHENRTLNIFIEKLSAIELGSHN